MEVSQLKVIKCETDQAVLEIYVTESTIQLVTTRKNDHGELIAPPAKVEFTLDYWKKLTGEIER